MSVSFVAKIDKSTHVRKIMRLKNCFLFYLLVNGVQYFLDNALCFSIFLVCNIVLFVILAGNIGDHCLCNQATCIGKNVF